MGGEDYPLDITHRPSRGLSPGERWYAALKPRHRCEAVIWKIFAIDHDVAEGREGLWQPAGASSCMIRFRTSTLIS